MTENQFDSLTDEQLVEKITSEGLTHLYSILYERYYKKVLEKCNSLLRNKDLAEDFAKDIFSKAFEKLRGFKGNSSFGSWLYSITYNYCIDYLRAKKKLHYPNWNIQNEIPEIIDEIIEEDMTEIHLTRLQKLMNLMHAEERAMLLMKYQDDLSIKDIATAMRLSEGAVKMRIKRSKARLLYMYSDLYGDY